MELLNEKIAQFFPWLIGGKLFDLELKKVMLLMSPSVLLAKLRTISVEGIAREAFALFLAEESSVLRVKGIPLERAEKIIDSDMSESWEEGNKLRRSAR